MWSLRFSPCTFPFITQSSHIFPKNLSFFSPLRINARTLSSPVKAIHHNALDSPISGRSDEFGSSPSVAGMEEAIMGYLFGRKRATEVAHSVWKHVLHKGDTVVDATCGNGHDTLAMLKMVSDESGRARVYGMDIQKDALKNTSRLLDVSLSPLENELVKLVDVCHSKIGQVVPAGAPLRQGTRLVAFNLGYLPGGNKAITTRPETTLLALEAAKEILVPGGLISLLVYVGHPGGREELEAIEGFGSALPVEAWCCCKFQMLNRPLAPVLVFFSKR